MNGCHYWLSKLVVWCSAAGFKISLVLKTSKGKIDNN